MRAVVNRMRFCASSRVAQTALEALVGRRAMDGLRWGLQAESGERANARRARQLGRARRILMRQALATCSSLSSASATMRPSSVRLFCSSARVSNLVGPSHPVSNLRPVIYDDALPAPSPKPGHPYSLSEFRGVRDYQWKLQRQQLDTFNHVFWAEVRAGKVFYISSFS